MGEKLQVAVLVENHPYDVVGFQKMLDSFADCECYVQPLDLFVQDADNRAHYDALVFYNMNIPLPAPGGALEKYMAEELGANGQGIVLLHHALLSFQRWEPYTQLSGVRRRGEDGLFRYTQNQTVDEKIVAPAHPVTAGVKDFSLVDETYIMGEPEEPGNEILIQTDNPNSIRNIAWARQYKASRVFCYASGHDNRVYADASFRAVVHNAILWTAKRK